MNEPRSAAPAGPSLVARLGRVGVLPAAGALLLSMPLSTLVAGHLLAAREERAAAALTARLGPRLALRAATRNAALRRPAMARALEVRTIGATLAALQDALPAGSALIGIEGDGARLTAEVDTAEPDRLRSALAAVPALAGLRTTGETALPDGGFRVRLATAR